MSIVLFELTGEMAMWRNVFESMGSYSCLGPAPSNLAGLIGAALGLPAPRSQAADVVDEKALKALAKGGLPWPLSPELLAWEQNNDFQVGCRWLGGTPRRGPWNVNGCKEITKSENLRLQQQVIIQPRYEVAVALPDAEANRVAVALQRPAFPLCLGASFCRAVVRAVGIVATVPSSPFWAFRSEFASLGEVTPFSMHVVNPDESFERIRSDGYWVYPTPDLPGPAENAPLHRGWLRLQKDR